MKTVCKALTIAAACALPLIKPRAWPVMTPEQLKAALEAIRTESATRSDFPFKITKIEYANDEIPKSLKGTGITSEYINVALTKHIEPFSLNIKNKADLGKAGERLKALSEELSIKDLGKRGVDTDQLGELGIKEVREITFDSILKNTFFNDTQREKAKAWLENKKKLEKAIEDYADNYPYDLFFYKCELYNQAVADEKQSSVISTEQTENRHIWGTYFTPRTEGLIYKTGEELREKIKNALKNMLLYKNGKEKVILLLLLDEATPKENRLKWGHNDDLLFGYQANNLITCDFNGEWVFLSHEIGHYLQMHFGLVQTFKDYRGSQTQENKFAKQLLLLDNAYPQNPMPIPSEMREYASQVDGSLFWLFDKDYFKCPDWLSLNEIFAYVQLLNRWQSTVEISNILGVYFNGNTLYLNALSDICELKRIRYTHGPKSWGDKIFKDLSTLPEDIQEPLRDIFSKASQMSLPKDMLELLCRLHGRPSEDAQNVVCDFNCKDDEEWKAQVKPVISDFIKAE